VQLTPLSTHWVPRKKIKKRVQTFSDTVYSNEVDNTKLDFKVDQIKKNEIGGTCSPYGREERCLQSFVGEAYG